MKARCLDVVQDGVADVLLLPLAIAKARRQRLLHFEHVAFDVAIDQILRPPAIEDAAVIDDDDLVAQALRLVHVVGGQQQRQPLPFEIEQTLPDHHPCLRVESVVGSSRITSSGLLIRARASTRRRFMPPDS